MMNLFKDCIDCEIRWPGCGVGCDTYKRDRKLLDEINEEKKKRQMFSIIPARDKRLPQK